MIIVVLQLLNIGLFSQNIPVEITSRNMGSSNIINSVTEYIAEVVLKKKDAFPENNNQSQDKSSSATHAFSKILAFNLFQIPTLIFTFNTEIQVAFFGIYKDKYNPAFVFEITPPPPKFNV